MANRIGKSESELRAYATDNSQTIVIREYENGNSYDYERKATEHEQKIIYGIIFGALLAINSGSDLRSVKDSSEYTVDILLKGVNGYDTIYNRIGNYKFE